MTFIKAGVIVSNGEGRSRTVGIDQMLPGGDRTVCMHPLPVDVIETFPTGNVLGHSR